MSSPLNKHSLMECTRHGTHRPAFICQHLQFGENVGFNEDDEPFDPEWPFRNAWCDECDKVLLREGEWNDVSEGFAKIMVICEGCLERSAAGIGRAHRMPTHNKRIEYARCVPEQAKTTNG